MNGIQKVIKIGAICFAVFIIANIVSAILWGISFVADIGFGTNENRESFSREYTNVESLEVDVSYANINIVSGSEFKVEASNVKKSFKVKEVNGTLKVSDKKGKYFGNHSNGNITIYVPYHTTLDKLTVDNGAGTISIVGITSSKLDVNQGAGKLEINHSTFYKTDIDGGAGEMNIRDSYLQDVDIDAGVGEVNIEASLVGDSKIDCGVGEMNVTLLGDKDDYKILVDKGIGNIKINRMNQKDNTTYGSGKNVLKLSGGVGSINVDFKAKTIGQ